MTSKLLNVKLKFMFLAEKPKVKKQIKLKTKEELAANMLANMNITG